MERYVYEVVEALGLEVSCCAFNLKYGFISFNTKSEKLLISCFGAEILPLSVWEGWPVWSFLHDEDINI